MEFRELRTFCTVARLGSISAAARALDLGQPAATKHLKKLEEEVGVDLLLRGKRPIQLTAAGTVLLEMAGPLVEGMGALETFRFDLQQASPVTIASTAILIAQALPGPVRSFRQRHPGHLLRLWPRNESDILAMVASGEADLGIIPTADVPVGFDFLPLFTIHRVLIAAKDHPVTDLSEITYSALARWPMVMMGARSRTRRLLDDAFQRRGISYELAVETDSAEAIKQYVAGGQGISVLPNIALSTGDAADLDILPLSNLMPDDLVGVVTLRGRPVSQMAQDFMEELGSLRTGGSDGSLQRRQRDPGVLVAEFRRDPMSDVLKCGFGGETGIQEHRLDQHAEVVWVAMQVVECGKHLVARGATLRGVGHRRQDVVDEGFVELR